MKRTVSSEAKQKLYPIIRWLLDVRDANHGMVTMNDVEMVIEQLCDWYEAQNTFTDISSSSSKEEKMCPLCDRLYIMNNRKFLRLWVVVLKALAEKPMTMTEVDAELHASGKLKGSGVTSTVKYGVLMRHWNVIDQTEEKRKGARVYTITQLGRDFINGKATIPSHVWLSPHGVVPEKTNEIARQVYSSEVEHDDSEEMSDRQKYVDEGESAFSI
jgi:DNA-binding PadR family transcriptional regulator